MVLEQSTSPMYVRRCSPARGMRSPGSRYAHRAGCLFKSYCSSLQQAAAVRSGLRIHATCDWRGVADLVFSDHEMMSEQNEKSVLIDPIIALDRGLMASEMCSFMVSKESSKDLNTPTKQPYLVNQQTFAAFRDMTHRCFARRSFPHIVGIYLAYLMHACPPTYCTESCESLPGASIANECWADLR
nr:hypothetical protein CFP56_65175 [Quercus suber]